MEFQLSLRFDFFINVVKRGLEHSVFYHCAGGAQICSARSRRMVFYDKEQVVAFLSASKPVKP